MPRIGVLTGGGPAPGFNAVIYGIVKPALDAGWEVLGIFDGWKGVLDGTKNRLLTYQDIQGIYTASGTILGTSRTNLAKVKVEGGHNMNFMPEGARIIREVLKLDVLVANGGEDTISVAERLWREHKIPVICTPKTIDGDVCGTERTYGLDTAANWVGNVIRGIHADFASTHYIAVVEVMGRKAGWLPLFGGIAGGAHDILIPEKSRSIAELADNVSRLHRQLGYCIIVVAEELEMTELTNRVSEGEDMDSFGHNPIALREKGWGKVIAEKLGEITGLTVRPIVLGHAQRGGPPSAYDIAMCLQIGQKVFELAQSGTFGKLVAWKNEQPVPVDLSLAGGGKFKPVPPEVYEPLLACLP